MGDLLFRVQFKGAIGTGIDALEGQVEEEGRDLLIDIPLHIALVLRQELL